MKHPDQTKTSPANSERSPTEPLFNRRVYLVLGLIAVVLIAAYIPDYLQADNESDGLLSFSHLLMLLFSLPLLLLLAFGQYFTDRKKQRQPSSHVPNRLEQVANRSKILLLFILGGFLSLIILSNL